MIIRTLCVYWQSELAAVGRPLYYLQLRTQTFHPPRSLEDQEATLLGPRYFAVLCGARISFEAFYGVDTGLAFAFYGLKLLRGFRTKIPNRNLKQLFDFYGDKH